MKQLPSPPRRIRTRPRVIFASPYILGNFNTAQSLAIEATRSVFGLDRGEIGKAADALISDTTPLENRLDILRTLTESDPCQRDYWRDVWPKLINHFQIELGTHLLLRPPTAKKAVTDLLSGLIERDVRIDIVCDWSDSLLEVLLDTVLPETAENDRFAAIDRSGLGAGGRGLWIGRTGQGSANAKRHGHAVLCIGDGVHEHDVQDATDYLDGPVSKRMGPSVRASGEATRRRKAFHVV